MLNSYLENLLFWALKVFVICCLIFVALLFLVLLIFKLLGHRIENSFVQNIIDLLGIYYLDNTEIPVKFRNISRILGNKLKANRLLLISGLHDLQTQILDKYSITSINEGQMKVNATNSATCLSVGSEYFLANNFTYVSKLVKHYRNQVPLNGLVLVFSITKLADITSDDLNKITKQLQNFGKYQNYPVYLVFDELSQLPGFDSFKQICSDTDMIVGYTESKLKDKNKYADSIGIANEIIGHIQDSLNKMIDMKYLGDDVAGDISQVLRFVINLKSILSQNLSNILQQLFYNDLNTFLRGVYLCDSENEIFCKNLFLNLIFLDNLVKMKNFSIKSFVTHNLFIFILICLVLCLPFTNKELAQKSLSVSSALTGIGNLSPAQNTYTIFSQLMINIQKILKNIPSSILIPMSWLDTLVEDLKRATSYYYSELFIKKLYSAYNHSVAEIVSIDFKPSYPKVLSTQDLFNSSEFLDLYYFSSTVLDLEKTEELMLKLDQNSSMESLNEISKRLFKFDLPQEYFDNPEYFKNSYKPGYVLSTMDSSKYAIHEVFLKRLEIFFSYYRSLNGFFKNLEALKNNLTFMQGDTNKYSVPELLELTKIIAQMRDLVDTKKLEWAKGGTLSYLSQKTEEEKENIAKLLNILNDCKSFDKDFIDIVTGKLKYENDKLKQDLLAAEIPIFGQIITTSPEGDFICSTSFEQLFSILNQLKDDMLLSNLKSGRTLNPDLIGVNNLIWNTPIVKELSGLLEKYNTKIKVKLESTTLQVRSYLYRVIANIYNDKMQNDLSAALEDPNLIVTSDQFSIDYRVNNMVENFSNLAMIASFAKQNQLLDLNFKLTTIISMQYDKLLSDLYSMIDQQGIYQLNQNALASDAIDSKFASNFIINSRSELSKLFEKAKPLMEALSNLYKNNDFLKKSEAYNRWVEIKAYFDLSADTSLEELDLFFTKLLNCKTIPSLIDFLNAYQNTPTDTWIGQRKTATLKMVQNKIDTYLSDAVKSLYGKVSANFDKYLKGYFPFASYTATDLPQDKMIAFYATWANDKEDVLSVLDSFKSDLAMSSSVEYKFLANIAKAMKWFDHIINPAGNPCSMTLQVRDLRSSENLVDQLGLWKVSFHGTNALVANPADDPVKTQVDVSINQAYNFNCLTYSGIDMIQQISPASQYLFNQIGDKTTNGFSYSSNFALLRFIATNFAMISNDLVYLKFSYPVISQTGQTDQLTSYVSVKLTGVQYFNFAG